MGKRAVMYVKKVTYIGEFCYLNNSCTCIRKSMTLMFMSSWRNKCMLSYQNSVTDVFVGFRPSCWCPSCGHQHGVSIQISINLGKTFLRISRIRNVLLTWNLARVFVYLPLFISRIPDFIYWMVLIFILIYCEWRDTENQQLSKTGPSIDPWGTPASFLPDWVSIPKLNSEED